MSVFQGSGSLKAYPGMNRSKVVYLIDDEFPGDLAAPLSSPRACEPGPGSLLLTDTLSRFSIVGGLLHYSAGSGWGDPGLWAQVGLARAAGRAMLVRTDLVAVGNQHYGWDGDQASTIATGNAIALNAGVLRAYDTASGPNLYTIVAGWAILATVLRSSGAFHLIRGAGLPDWTLLWPAITNATTPLYPAFSNSSIEKDIDYLRVTDFPAPWDTDNGIATNAIPAAGVGEETTSLADAIIEATWTAVAGQVYELSVRRTDDDNRWIVRGDQVGGTIKLIERNAGVETERGSAAQVWTPGNIYRVVVTQFGDTIKAVSANSNKFEYALASFNNTATGVKTSHAVTNLITWPRTISGAALTALTEAGA